MGLKLWFDVEERYNTTLLKKDRMEFQLWFDVEERYNTTEVIISAINMRCGLMQKKDITQPQSSRCGLALGLWFDVEERYNTTNGQFVFSTRSLWFDVEERYNTTLLKIGVSLDGCGLMQKKDITQQRV